MLMMGHACLYAWKINFISDYFLDAMHSELSREIETKQINEFPFRKEPYVN